ncbi:hypothetical protein SDC9_76520 [bioreactor metagenome]|uniref:Uncharacterized protein n=1 Tax=bioreactor metagenome TaxID=1076179 RepID=A0A644YPQ6_9ZZZZ
MKKVRKLLGAAIAAAVLASVLGGSALASPAGDFTVENGVLTKYSGSGGDVVIPDGVTAIGYQAFNGEEDSGTANTVSVTIPDSVTGIADGSFYHCFKLTKFIVGGSNQKYSAKDGVLLSKDGTALVQYPCGKTGDYTIPDGVTAIQNSAFLCCMGQGGSLKIPDSMTKIGDNAFSCCGMSAVTIPDSVTSIGAGAFFGCGNLTGVTIGDNVSNIGSNCFLACDKLAQISVGSGNKSFTSADGVLLTRNGAILMQYPCGKAGASYTLPDSVTGVVSGAFHGSGELTQILVGSANQSYYSENGMLIAKSGAVLWCCPAGKTGTVKVPDSVQSFASEAFGGCTKITGLIIPSTVTDIRVEAFNGAGQFVIYAAAGSQAQTFVTQYGYMYGMTYKTISAAASATASSVLVNGKPVSFEAYSIDGNNYFKLRDLAKVLSGTAKQFEVGWDGVNNAISLTTGKAYTIVGGELSKSSGAASVSAAISSSGVYLDGKAVGLTAYTIGGNNYFKLRDVAAALDFGVTWNGAANTIAIDTASGYTP